VKAQVVASLKLVTYRDRGDDFPEMQEWGIPLGFLVNLNEERLKMGRQPIDLNYAAQEAAMSLPAIIADDADKLTEAIYLALGKAIAANGGAL
jgi:hypothetical protein